MKYSFPPIVPAGARLLILGTLPGEESLRLQQYYSHARNHFWPIVAALADKPLPVGYSERTALLDETRWALWDVLECAERIGSSDAAIRSPAVNDFAEFFAAHQGIAAIAFNGQKARELFRRFVVRPGSVAENRFTAIDLPSSSPLYTISFEEKLAVWRDKLTPYLAQRPQNRRAK